MLGGFTRSLSALVHFTLHIGAGVDSVVYMVQLAISESRKTIVLISVLVGGLGTGIPYDITYRTACIQFYCVILHTRVERYE